MTYVTRRISFQQLNISIPININIEKLNLDQTKHISLVEKKIILRNSSYSSLLPTNSNHAVPKHFDTLLH